MFVISLILSFGLLALTYLLYRWKAAPAAAVLLPAFLGLFLTPVIQFQSILTIIGVMSGRMLRWPTKRFVIGMALAMVGPYAGASWLALSELNRLKGLFPYESIEERLPSPPPSENLPLSDGSSSQLSKLEELIGEVRYHGRVYVLRDIHQNQVERFINSPGFGMMRRIRLSEHTVKLRPDKSGKNVLGKPIAQPEKSSVELDGNLREPADANSLGLRALHGESLFDFSNPLGFGLVESRKRVAGFQSHQFSGVPETADWIVERIELLGLLLNPKPRVYLSDELPNMDALRGVPTRELNAFETEGLGQLRKGDDLYIRETSDATLMLGSVRNAKQCIECHGGTRGDLLGAFSYRLKRLQ